MGVWNAILDVTGTNQARAVRKENKEQARMIKEAEAASEGDLLKNLGKSYETDSSRYKTDVQANGMPKGQLEAMKFQMEQAKKGVASSYAGGQKGRSGAALKALSDRQQGIASQNYQQAFDNNMNANNQNFNQNLNANNANFGQQASMSQQALDNRTNFLNAKLGNSQNKANQGASETGTIGKIFKAFNPFG